MGVFDREIGFGEIRPELVLLLRGLRREEVDSDGGGAAEGTNSFPSTSQRSYITFTSAPFYVNSIR